MRRAASAAIAVVLLDLTAVGVQVPNIRADLGSSPSGGQWILNAYLLALAAALPLAAALRIPNRLLSALGALTMAAGAVVGATADSTATLVPGRAISGAGVALLLTAVALPSTRRTTTAAVALPLAALAFGPLVGGELAEHNWWHLYCWAGVPAAAILAALALRDDELAQRAPRPLSVRRLALVAGLVVMTILFVQSEPWDLGTRAVVEVVGLAATGLVVMRVVTPESSAWAAASGALAALCLLMPQYFELAHLIHPLRSGALLSVLTVAAVAGGALAWRLRSATSARALAVAGIVIAGVALLALSTIGPDTATALLGVGMVVAGGGLGLCAGATDERRPGELIVAAATAAAFVVAVSGAVFQQVQANERASAVSFDAALSQGVGEAAAFLGVLALVMLIGLWRPTPASSAARPAVES